MHLLSCCLVEDRQGPAYSAGGMMGGEFRGEACAFLSGFTAGSHLGGYRLEQQLGVGMMAVVFRAWDERLGRRVALKILAPALAADEEFRGRFTREARAAAAVDDPHIIPVFEAGEAGGALFIAMRYVPGGDARSLLRRVGPLPAARAAAIVSSVASALDAAHGAGLVHRDVKPANMLVDVRPGRPDHVYLSDFGLSKRALSASGPSGPGQFLGTVNFAAPEQIAGRRVDGRADQYSLACAAFELLSGAPPFRRDYAEAVIWAHVSEPPPRLTARRPELPAAVDGVLARALAKAPEDRYASCREFADALCGALNPAPDHAAVIRRRAGRWRTRIVWPPTAPAEQPAGVLAGASSGVPGSSAPGETTAASGYGITPAGPAGLPLGARHARARLVRPANRKSRLTMQVGMLIAAVFVVAAFNPPRPIIAPYYGAPSAQLRRAGPVAYLGVSVAGQPSYRPVADFADAAGRRPNLAGYSSGWGEPFAASFARTIWRHRALPLVQIDPSGVSLPAIADGLDDMYLRAYARSVRNFGHAVIIGFGQDMNAPGHSWGYGNVSGRTFVAAWRHIVKLFRHQGADNVTWVWTVSARRRGTSPAASWWPGSAYVGWAGVSGRYSRPSGTFASVFGHTISQVRQLTNKPVLASVTSAGPPARQPRQISRLFAGLNRYPVVALMWPSEDLRHENRQASAAIHGSLAAGNAFRLAVAGLPLVPIR
jgi:serine/threonine-protein kinase